MTNNQVDNPIEQDALAISQDDTPAGNDKTNDGMRMALNYAAPSHVSLSADQQSTHSRHVALFTQLERDAVSFHGTVKDPLVFRDSLLALFDVVSSDYRYVPKDRAAYAVFMQMRRASRHKNLFSAQRDYFTWLFDNDPLAFCLLDPIIQVHQTGVSFEVFSRDEGCYAQLTLQHGLFETDAAPVLGTTSIDYSSALFDGIEQIRDHQTTTLDIGQEAVRLQRSDLLASTDNAESEMDATVNDDNKYEVIEKRINVPKSWIRALLQVQSAGQLAHERIDLDPIALYNVLFELRMHADIKGKRRGLLIELIPQQLPVIILEPFDIAVTSQVSRQQTPYQGQKAKLIRLWGRRRLSLLKRLLPHTDTVSVSLLGQGMPSYWTLTGKGFHFTFAMTGFSQANWSQSLNFDLLLPTRPQQNALKDESHNDDVLPLIQALAEQPSRIDVLTERLSALRTSDNLLTASYVRQQLLSGAQQGLIRYDMANQSYYYRPLTQTPLDMAQFAHHSEAEKQAFDLVGRKDSVQNLSVQTIATQGVSISADIHVKEDRRTYQSQLQLGEDGLVSRAVCSCPQYLQHRLSQGICAHLIALRLSYHQYDHTQTNSWHDTRTLSKRVPKLQPKMRAKSSFTKETAQPTLPTSNILDLSTLAQGLPSDDTHAKSSSNNPTAHTVRYVYLTCDHKKLLIEQVIDDDSTRQQFVFNQPADAHAAFLQHIARFEAKGFIENKGV